MRVHVIPLVALASLANIASAISFADDCSKSDAPPLPPSIEFPTSSSVNCSGKHARTKPPAGAIVVDITGKYEGSFKTLTEGIANIPNTTEVTTVFIFPGVYVEQVVVEKITSPLVIQGYTCNTMKYSANQVTVTQAKAQREVPPEITQNRNFFTSTMGFKSQSGVKVYNLNVANTAGEIVKDGQAVAVYVDNTDYGFYACNFTGFQDTLCANKGRELYVKSYIRGTVDIVFGQRAMAWFESCDIEAISKGFITANGNQNETVVSEFVFNKARVFGLKRKVTMLGRPWREYARVVFQQSKLGEVVDPKGWSVWDDTMSTKNVYLNEYNNTGLGAELDGRVEFSGQLDAAKKMSDILGKGHEKYWWVDTKFF
ncbi:uncharacterized protein CCR75_005758 [Bremia lactucae]|uniref:Pectinesterase n=1 Tax=Bremia lactucae TaxID=4779 RepID=A0A976FG24_BRELC|nr:hypothetical protein CCR75_005758 [Bremia lactucae]